MRSVGDDVIGDAMHSFAQYVALDQRHAVALPDGIAPEVAGALPAALNTGGDGVNVVLDHVAGQTFADGQPITHEDGRVVQIGRLAGARSTIDIDALSYRNLTVCGVSFGFSRPAVLGQNMRELEPEVLAAVSRGEIRPVIDRTMPWTRHEDAAARLPSGEARGKIVLTIGAT